MMRLERYISIVVGQAMVEERRTVCDDQRKVTNATAGGCGVADGLEVDGDVVEQDEEAPTQATTNVSFAFNAIAPSRSSI